MRNQLPIALRLTALMVFSLASYGQNKDAFAESQSMLLFAGNSGDLVVVTPTANVVVPNPPGSIAQYASPLPALGPTGDQVGLSIKFPVDFVFVPCSQPGCVQPRSAKYKSVMGIYSLHNKAWKLYGDFCSVGSAAFTPDRKKVAFKAKARSGNPECAYRDDSETLLILDLETGQSTPVPNTGKVSIIGRLSWAPDGRYIAAQFSNGDSPNNLIVLIEVGSWAQKVLTEGTDPSWSPKGDWVAYEVDDGRRCMLIHPDGSGAKRVLRRFGGWAFYGGAVWSPDGDKLLLNEEEIDGDAQYALMLDLATGRVSRKSKNGSTVFGWAPQPDD